MDYIHGLLKIHTSLSHAMEEVGSCFAVRGGGLLIDGVCTLTYSTQS